MGMTAMKSRVLNDVIRAFLGSIIIGVCLFGVPIALGSAYDAWVNPVVMYGKSRVEERTILGNAAEGFCCGAVLGGLAGAIFGATVAVERLLKGTKATRE
jgi:hypothetical protein